MDENLYDEFGNYIGPELDSDSEGDDSDVGVADGEGGMDEEASDGDSEAKAGSDDAWAAAHAAGGAQDGGEEGGAVDALGGSQAIVLHEDKKYYPDAEEVFGDAEVIVQDEDTMGIEEPIIAPVTSRTFSVLEKRVPSTTYSNEFLVGLLDHPALIRNVAVVGHLHHGKTSVVDCLLRQTHAAAWDPKKSVRYTDARTDERARGVSVKCTPVSIVLPDATGKSHLVNVCDAPGHLDFGDEVSAALRLADAAVVVVDAVEGVMLGTERVLKQAVAEQLPVLVVINKLDRLITELKLPPADAYHKLAHTLEEVNAILAFAAPNAGPGGAPYRVSPELGNVCFSSGEHGWCFSVPSFARLYAERHPGVPPRAFARRLWGDWFHDADASAFTKSPPRPGAPRTFVAFVLQPLYKLYAQLLGESPARARETLRAVGVTLSKAELHLDPHPLLRVALHRFLGASTAFADMVVRHAPSPVAAARRKCEHTYTGAQDSAAAVAMRGCDASGPLMVNVVKLFATPDGRAFRALGRVLSGTVRQGQQVRVLGEGFAEDGEDVAGAVVETVAIGQARYVVEMSRAPAGAWVLLGGIDGSINKTATVTDAGAEAAVFRPLAFTSEPTVKVAIEPLKPAELPKVLDGLRKISRTYPLLSTRVEESGEHVIIGTGELYMDCALRDLREMYSGVEVRVADPTVAFCESVQETSSVKCIAKTQNDRNSVTFLAEPLDRGLADDIEAGEIDLGWDPRRVRAFFQSKHGWDALAARSVWAFGPGTQGPNALLDDTLPGEVDKSLLNTVRDSVVQGFRWGCREGPLCEEPVRNVKFKLLDATVSDVPIHRGGGQIIPAARRVVYSSMLTAQPRLLEPVNLVEILAPADAVEAVERVLGQRRGHVTHQAPKPGTPFFVLKAFIPVLDAFGFETDLRVHTMGQAFCLQVFDHFDTVPGDPLDQEAEIPLHGPAGMDALARDILVKTRRRKGLSADLMIEDLTSQLM